MKSHFHNIFFIILGSIGIMVALVYFNHRNDNHGFERKFLSIKVKYLHAIKLPLAHLNFAGELDNSIILKDYRNPKLLYSVNFLNSRLDKIPTKLPVNFNLKSRYFNIDLLNNNLFVSNVFGEALIINKHRTIYSNIKNLTFDQIIVLSPRSIIVRSVNQKGKSFERFLHKIQLTNNNKIQSSFRLVPQIDGFFCNDGWLKYDSKVGKIVYTYFYRGNFLCLDTNLTLLYKGKTIDTISIAKIKVSESSIKLVNGRSQRSINQSTPPVFINKIAALDAGKIYVLSALRADNETYLTFVKNQVVDVYATINGLYLYSFYMPKYKGLKPYEIQIKNNFLIAIYGNYIVSFNLNSS